MVSGIITSYTAPKPFPHGKVPASILLETGEGAFRLDLEPCRVSSGELFGLLHHPAAAWVEEYRGVDFKTGYRSWQFRTDRLHCSFEALQRHGERVRIFFLVASAAAIVAGSALVVVHYRRAWAEGPRA